MGGPAPFGPLNQRHVPNPSCFRELCNKTASAPCSVCRAPVAGACLDGVQRYFALESLLRISPVDTGNGEDGGGGGIWAQGVWTTDTFGGSSSTAKAAASLITKMPNWFFGLLVPKTLIFGAVVPDTASIEGPISVCSMHRWA